MKNYTLRFAGLCSYDWAFPDRCTAHFGLTEELERAGEGMTETVRDFFSARLRLIELIKTKLGELLRDRRIKTALTKRPCGQPRTFLPGMLVDIWHEGINKKSSFYEGPYTIVSQFGGKC